MDAVEHEQPLALSAAVDRPFGIVVAGNMDQGRAAPLMAPGMSRKREVEMDHDESASPCATLLFSIRRSVRYHCRRRMFFQRFHRITTAGSLILGSAAVAGFMAQNNLGYWAAGASALGAVLSAITLAVGTTQAIQLHDDLGRRFLNLEKELVRAGENATEELVLRVTLERLDIEADEPPILKVLDIICHNELARAMGCGPEHMWEVGPLQRWLANVVDFREHTLRKCAA
jgi:hypothetical protein